MESCCGRFFNWEAVCIIFMTDTDGSNTVTMTAGSDLAWSLDGSKITFTESDDLLNLSDRNLVNLTS